MFHVLDSYILGSMSCNFPFNKRSRQQTKSTSWQLDVKQEIILGNCNAFGSSLAFISIFEKVYWGLLKWIKRAVEC